MMLTTMATVVTYPTAERSRDQVCHGAKKSLGAQEISPPSCTYDLVQAMLLGGLYSYGVPSTSNQSTVVRMALEVGIVARDSIYTAV